MLKIGDRVKFLSDTGAGIVTKIEKDIVWVEVEDGFELPSTIANVVPVSKEDELEILARIGVENSRPGSKIAKHKSKKETEKKKETEVYKRYGKISLVADDELEDNEELLDLYEIKEKYVKNLLAARQREKEIEQEELIRNINKENSTESSKSVLDATLKTEKPKVILLEELAANKDNERSTLKKAIQQKKKKTEEIEVIDLHAHEILETTNGMTNGEIIVAQLSRFTISLDSHVKQGKRGKVIYIHGVGKRKLRSEIEHKLKISYPNVQFQDASFKEYGFGAILIIY